MNLLTKIRHWWLKRFPRYQRLSLLCLSYKEADSLLRKNEGLPEDQKWHLAVPENDTAPIGVVWLERKRRILE